MKIKRWMALFVAAVMILQSPAMVFAQQTNTVQDNTSGSEVTQNEDSPETDGEIPSEAEGSDEDGEDSSEEETSDENGEPPSGEEAASKDDGENPSGEEGSDEDGENPSDEEEASDEDGENPSDEEEASDEDEENPSGEEGTSEKDGENPSGEEDSFTFTSVYIPDQNALPDSRELFEGYVQQQLGEAFGNGISTYSDFSVERLSQYWMMMYYMVQEVFENIACGEWSNAEVNFWQSDIYKEDGSQTFATIDEIVDFVQKFVATYTDVLLADQPYEMYWFDKTQGVEYTYNVHGKEGEYFIGALTLHFAVSEDYAGSEEFTVDTDKTSRAAGIVERIQDVIDLGEDKGDEEKLTFYKDYICEAVSYNENAAGNTDTPYGDPWQLIYVFDEDPATNVVCEGYAKAFQYLCDETMNWQEDSHVLTVTGTVDIYEGSTLTSSGAHMWNVVMIDGVNYLADITNSDAGAIGEDGGLFLVSEPVFQDESGKTYQFKIGNKTIQYTYDDNMKDLHAPGYLYLGERKSTSVLTPDFSQISVADTTYNGTATREETELSGDITFQNADGQEVKLINSVDYQVVAELDAKDAGIRKVTYTVTLLDSAAKMYSLENNGISDGTDTVTIKKKPIEVDILGDTEVVYGETYQHEVSVSEDTPLEEGDEVSFRITYTGGSSETSATKEGLGASPMNAGTYVAKVFLSGGKDVQNYELKDHADMEFRIVPAIPAITKKLEILVKYSNTDEQKVLLTDSNPTYLDQVVAGKFVIGEAITGDEILAAGYPKVKADGESIVFALKAGLTKADKQKSTTFTYCFVPTDTKNYQQVTGTVTVSVVANIVDDIQLSIADWTYGKTPSAPVYSSEIAEENGMEAELSYSGQNAKGDAYAPTSEQPADPGEYTVTVTYSKGDYYGSKSCEFTIHKEQAKLTGISVPANKEFDNSLDFEWSGDLRIAGVGDDELCFANPTDPIGKVRFTDVNVGENKPLVMEGVSALGDTEDSWKYESDLWLPSLTASIKKARVEVIEAPYINGSQEGEIEKVYDGTTDLPKGTTIQFETLHSESLGIFMVTTGGNRYNDANVNDIDGKSIVIGYAASCDKYDLKNLDILLPETITWGTITPAPVEVTISGPASVSYGTTYAHSAKVTGGLMGNDVVSAQVRYRDPESGGLCETPNSTIGCWELTAKLDSDNYEIRTIAGVDSFEITKKEPNFKDVEKIVSYSDHDDHNITLEEFKNDTDDADILSGCMYVVGIYGMDSEILAERPGEGERFEKYRLRDDLTRADVGKSVSFQLKFVPAEFCSDFYKGTQVSYTVTVGDKENIEDVKVTMDDWIYGADEHPEPVCSTLATGGKWTLQYQGCNHMSEEYEGDEPPVDPGYYKVMATYENDTQIGTAIADFEIKCRPLYYKGTVEDKEYDGTRSATVTSLEYDGVVEGDSLDELEEFIDARFEFEDEKVGENKQVRSDLYQNSLSGSDEWKYYMADEQPILRGNIVKPTSVTLVGEIRDRFKLNLQDVDEFYGRLIEENPQLSELFQDMEEMKKAMCEKAKETLSDVGSNVQYLAWTMMKNNGNGQWGSITAGDQVKALIPYPSGTDQTYSFTIVHMNSDDGSMQAYSTEDGTAVVTENGIELLLASHGAFAVTWRANSINSDGSSGNNGNGTNGSGAGSNHYGDSGDRSDDSGSSFAEMQSEFWSEVRAKIEKAGSGDTVKVYAGAFDQMSWKVMHALRNHSGVTLIIEWNGGETITIPAGMALADETGRVYYPLSYLVEQYRNGQTASAAETLNAGSTAAGGTVMSVAAPAVSDRELDAESITPATDGIVEDVETKEAAPVISEEEDSASSQLIGEEDSEAADAMADTDLAEGDLDDSGSNAGVIVLVVVIVALVVGGVIFCCRRRRENKN